MKKLLFLLIVATVTVLPINAQELNPNASYIRKNYSSEYEATIKKLALEEWNNDFNMVLYEINKQSDALVELVKEFKSDNTNIAYWAIQEWSIDGYLDKNIAQLKKFEVFSLENLLKLHCDWTMVKYEYDKQTKAKNAF